MLARSLGLLVCGYVGGMSQQRGAFHGAPKFSAFLLTGALSGLLIGFLLSVLGPVDTRYDASSALGFFGLIGAGLGLLVGGVIAVVVDRRS